MGTGGWLIEYDWKATLNANYELDSTIKGSGNCLLNFMVNKQENQLKGNYKRLIIALAVQNVYSFINSFYHY